MNVLEYTFVAATTMLARGLREAQKPTDDGDYTEDSLLALCAMTITPYRQKSMGGSIESQILRIIATPLNVIPEQSKEAD
jgi:hypothetical protein